MPVHAGGPESQDGKSCQRRQRQGRDPIGLGGSVGSGQMRLDGHECGGKGELQANMNEQRGRPFTGSSADDRSEQRKTPNNRAGNRRTGKPQPPPNPRQRIGGTRHHREIEHDGPWAGLLRVDKKRNGERTGEAEASQRGSVQSGSKHGGNADGTQHDEGRCGTDELVERVRGIDRAEGADSTRGCQHARDVTGRDGFHR